MHRFEIFYWREQDDEVDFVLRKKGSVVAIEVKSNAEKRTDRFVPMPKRWIVERTFSWLENFRRLTIDYEYRADTHEAMLHIAAIKLFLNKI